MPKKIRSCNENCQYFLRFPDSSGQCYYSGNPYTVNPEDVCKHDLLTDKEARKILSPEQNMINDIYGIRSSISNKVND